MNQRYFTIINGALIALSAYFAADIVNSIIEKKIEAVPPVIANIEKGQTSSPKRDINSYSVIFEKNLFGSEYPKTKAEGDAPARPAVNIKLIGTVTGGSDFSYAVIEENNEQAVYKLNQKIADGSMVIKVSYKGITLKAADGSTKEVPIFEDTNIVEIKPPNKGASPNVKKVSDNSFIVDQREVTNSLENMNQLLTQARVAPIIDNGKTTGFKIFEIKPNSLYEKIGLSNGDVVQRINGVEIDDPNKFFQTYQNLKDEKSISVDIVRNGVKQTLSYEIR